LIKTYIAALMLLLIAFADLLFAEPVLRLPLFEGNHPTITRVFRSRTWPPSSGAEADLGMCESGWVN